MPDTVTATASDDDRNTVTKRASASVSVSDVTPTISVTKATGAPSVAEPGAPVTYTVTVRNDSPRAGLRHRAVRRRRHRTRGSTWVPCRGPPVCCPVPWRWPAAWSCTFTTAVTGDAGDAVHDTVTASASDDDGNTTTAERFRDGGRHGRAGRRSR